MVALMASPAKGVIYYQQGCQGGRRYCVKNSPSWNKAIKATQPHSIPTHVEAVLGFTASTKARATKTKKSELSRMINPGVVAPEACLGTLGTRVDVFHVPPCLACMIELTLQDAKARVNRLRRTRSAAMRQSCVNTKEL